MAIPHGTSVLDTAINLDADILHDSKLHLWALHTHTHARVSFFNLRWSLWISSLHTHFSIYSCTVIQNSQVFCIFSQTIVSAEFVNVNFVLFYTQNWLSFQNVRYWSLFYSLFKQNYIIMYHLKAIGLCYIVTSILYITIFLLKMYCICNFLFRISIINISFQQSLDFITSTCSLSVLKLHSIM